MLAEGLLESSRLLREIRERRESITNRGNRGQERVICVVQTTGRRSAESGKVRDGGEELSKV